MQLDDARLQRIEEDIRSISRGVANLEKTLEGDMKEGTMWRRTVCDVHSSRIDVLEESFKGIEKKVDNRWPTLLAAFFGGMLPILGVISAFHETIGTLIKLASNG